MPLISVADVRAKKHLLDFARNGSDFVSQQQLSSGSHEAEPDFTHWSYMGDFQSLKKENQKDYFNNIKSIRFRWWSGGSHGTSDKSKLLGCLCGSFVFEGWLC